MSERREYLIDVCSKCGEQIHPDADGNPDIYSGCDCDGDAHKLATVTIIAEWQTDPIAYGLDRHGLIVKPQATIVPPPGT